MSVLDELERFQEAAMKNQTLREQILETRNEAALLTAFCRLACGKGYEINAMDLLYAGEEAYASMRRAANGGGENSPMLENEDDYYSLFMAAMEAAGPRVE